MLWLGLWTLLGGAVTMLGFFIVVLLTLSSGPQHILPEVLQVAVVGLVFGACLYLLNLPYMILGFVSPFFRERLQTCLKLEPAAPMAKPGESAVPPAATVRQHGE
jgi:hypothetical protein